MGRSLIVEKFNGTAAKIDLEKLPSTGIYFAKILNADGNVIESEKVHLPVNLNSFHFFSNSIKPSCTL